MKTNISGKDIDALLSALEVQMSDEQKAIFEEHLNDTLAERVGLAVVDLIEDDELDEYLNLVEEGNTEELAVWLQKHVPDIKDVISDEVDILLGDIAESSDNL